MGSPVEIARQSALSTAELDAILSIQLTVAWAGKREGRLGWWRTELTDPEAGGDFFERLVPRSHAWAARLRDVIRSDFTIDAPGSDEARAAFLADHPQEAEAAVRTEAARRARKKTKAEGDAQIEMDAGDAETDGDDNEAEDTRLEEAADA